MHCAHAQVDCLEMDPYMTELFGRGNREGLLHWLRDGTLVINNVHKVRQHTSWDAQHSHDAGVCWLSRRYCQ